MGLKFKNQIIIDPQSSHFLNELNTFEVYQSVITYFMYLETFQWLMDAYLSIF